MSDAVLFDYDPVTMTKQWFVPSDDGEQFTIVSETDHGPLLEANAEERKYHRGGERWGGGRIHSRIPNTVLFDLVKKGILGPDMNLNTPAATKWVNSSENIWKIRHGRV